MYSFVFGFFVCVCVCVCVCVICLVTQLCLTLFNLMDCNPPGSSIHGDSPGIKTRSPTLQVNSLSSKPPGKPQVV